jgi:streptomycin 3"-adenylyltransferase
MRKTSKNEIEDQLAECLKILKKIFSDDLLGVYLFGSCILGGLQKYSDIDLFVVTNRKSNLEDKKRLIAALLQISGIYKKSSKYPIEMTVVEKGSINPWQYPPLFDFQYGEWLRESFENGIIEPWQTNEMPDLAVIVTQVLLKSQTLSGVEPKQVLPPVPYGDFMKAMIHDIDRLATELEEDTRNVLLTYARIWNTLETNEISSKPAAADWVMHRLPKEYLPVMMRAKSICLGKENEHWDDLKKQIKPCATFIVEKIYDQIPLITFDHSHTSIKLAEDK